MEDQRNSDSANDFKLERYKYILRQIEFLNQSTYRVLALLQTLATAIIGGIVGILLTYQNLDLDTDLARVGIRGLLLLLVLLGLYVSASITVGIASWFDYRKEEVEIVNEVVGPDYRRHPKLKNFWRWSESYLAVFTIISIAAIFAFVESQIIPHIE